MMGFQQKYRAGEELRLFARPVCWWLTGDCDRAMIVTVIAVLMMQAAVDDKIRMVAMRDLLMCAALMRASTRDRRASVRIRGVHFEGVLIVMALMLRVQVAVVQIVSVSIMHDAGMAAVVAVNVRMVGMYFVAHQTVLSGAVG